jgi:hypothetical protein
MRTTTSYRRAFTLIELLVPSLTGMREKANRMKCMSNTRQLVLAAINYAGDHNGALPYPNWNNSIGALPNCPPGWAFDAHNKLTGTNTDGALWPYLKDNRVYHCPNDRAPFTPGASLVLKLTSYVMSGWVCGINSTVCQSLAPAYAYNYSMFKPRDVLFWEGSASAMSSSGDLSSTPNEGMTFRHNSSGAYACFDGHADIITSNDYINTVVKNTSTRNQFWCNPKSDNGH